MGVRLPEKYFFSLKRVGACFAIIGTCGLLYQFREPWKYFNFAPTNVHNAQRTPAQFIYLDDPRFKDILMFHSDPHSVSKKPKSFSATIFQWWQSLNHTVAYRYLNIAKSGTKPDRFKAISQLAALRDLKDWHYHQLALMLDARTAVALARISHSDLRYFLKPPNRYDDKKLYETIDELYYLLSRMDKLCKNNHRCLTQFLSKKFFDSRLESPEFDHDLINVGLTGSPPKTWNEQLLMSCIQIIYHHSSIEQFSRDIAEAEGLLVLVDIQRKHFNNINICILLAKIISNLSLHQEYLEAIFKSGWIGILAAWSRHKDVRLAAPAARALANLDTDSNNNEKFPRRIYLLHPTQRTQTPAKLDVVFVHGLLGGVFVTWRQRDSASTPKSVEPPRVKVESDFLTDVIGEHPQEFFNDLAQDLQKKQWSQLGQDFEVVLDDCPVSMNETARGPFTCSGNEMNAEYDNDDRLVRTECWPKDWLPQDLPSLRVIGINYDTNLSYWSPPCPIESTRSTMNERSVEFSTKLITAGVGKRPIVWVCHSMGGLLVKQMLVEEWKKGDQNKFCENTRAIIFYSTPHRGSHVATLKQTTQMLILPSIEVQELREESPKLLTLHENFLKVLKEYPMEIISFSETKSTLLTALKLPLQFVLPKSAHPGVGEFYEIPQDHLSICKPANRQSFLYRKVLNVLQKHVPQKSPHYLSR